MWTAHAPRPYFPNILHFYLVIEEQTFLDTILLFESFRMVEVQVKKGQKQASGFPHFIGIVTTIVLHIGMKEKVMISV